MEMKTNKQLWKERHAQGKTKLDVAIETQENADAGEIGNMIDKAESKKRKVSVDSKAEAKKTGEEKAAKQEAKIQKQLENEGSDFTP